MIERNANPRRFAIAATAVAAVLTTAVSADAQTVLRSSGPLPTTSATIQATDRDGRDYEALVPVVQGWYDGRISLYLSTDSSRRDVARMTHTNFVPKLTGAIAGGAVDDIYQLTNFKQGNVLPSSPAPAGPENADPAYTPLWQLSLVTWVSGQPRTLTSERAVLAEQALGHVRIVKTDVVINCPVIFTPRGGVLYGVRISR